MSKNKLTALEKEAIETFEKYFLELEYGPSKDPSKAKKIAYWLKDYVKFLDYEKEFDPKKYKKYKRGDIINVHLGFNIGNEYGGLHYAVVIKESSPRSGIVNIVPLTSCKKGYDINKLHPYDIYLGNNLFDGLTKKQLNEISNRLDKMEHGSIALVGQITTISKIRIYEPKHSNDILSGVSISNENLDKIDKKIVELYTKNQK